MSTHFNPSFTPGFAFVNFVNEHDARDAIRYLDSTMFDHSRCRLSIEWEKSAVLAFVNGPGLRLTRGLLRHYLSLTLTPTDTRIRDIERHFEPFGKVLHVRIQRNFAFVQFHTQEHATKTLECTHMRSPVLRRGRPSPDYGSARSPVYDDRYIHFVCFFICGRNLTCTRSRSPVCR
ncbi:hypothetical protein MKX03_000702 [Papaver bracteatum]|nr:hypothetical protein MKX03_000702 [Papaver bracteatum]